MEICPLPLKDKGKSGRQHVKLVQPLKPDSRALKVTNHDSQQIKEPGKRNWSGSNNQIPANIHKTITQENPF